MLPDGWTEYDAECWLRDQFEFENCDECGRDEEHHVCVKGPFGLPFAYCIARTDTGPVPDMDLS